MENDQPGIPGQLAAEITLKYAELEATAQQSTVLALQLGDLLIQAKDQCRHGEWLPWLKRRFDKSVRLAQNYMALARQFPPERRHTIRDIPLREALRLLSSKKPESKKTFAHDRLSIDTLYKLHDSLSFLRDIIEERIVGVLQEEGVTDRHEAMRQAKRIIASISRLRNYADDQLRAHAADDSEDNGCDQHDEAADMLGVIWPCTPAALDAAYRSKAKTAHPDAGGSHAKFVALQEAYELLRDALATATA